MRIALLAVAVALAVVIAAVIAAAVLYRTGGIENPDDELFKSLLQLVVVGLTSLVVSALVSLATAREAARKGANEIVRTALTNLNKAYNDIKEIRRSTRAQSIRAKEGVTKIGTQSYDALLGRLNEAQLSLELISKYLEEVKLQIGKSGAVEHIGRMESYLGEMIKEWEEKMPVLRGELKDDVGFEDLPKFSDLRLDFRASRFRTEFHDPYDGAFAELIGKLVRS